MAETCCICCEGLSTDCVITKCGHIFHQACLARWLREKKICPQCRGKLSRKTTVQTLLLNPLELVCGAVEDPEEYINSFESTDRTQAENAFNGLRARWLVESGSSECPVKSTPVSAPEPVNNEELDRLTLALRKSSEKARSFEAANQFLVEKLKQEKEQKGTIMNAVNTLNGKYASAVHLRDIAQSEQKKASATSKVLKRENKLLKESLNKISKESNVMKSEMAVLKQIKMAEMGDANEAKKLDLMIFSKSPEEALAALKPIYLHIKVENKRLKKRSRDSEREGSATQHQLRRQVSSLKAELQTARNELEDEVEYGEKCVKRITTLKRKLTQQREELSHSEEKITDTPGQAAKRETVKPEFVKQETVEPLKKRPSLTMKGNFPVDFGPTPAKPKKRTSGGLLATFKSSHKKKPFGINKRKNAFASGGKKKKRPFRL